MIDAEDYQELQRFAHESTCMIEEMRGLLDKLYTTWENGNDDGVFDLLDSEVIEMLQRFEPREDD